MDNDIKIWLPPMLTLLGTLIAIVFTAWLSNRAILAKMEALRESVRADAAILRLEFVTATIKIDNKLDHVIETQATHSERLSSLEGKGGK